MNWVMRFQLPCECFETSHKLIKVSLLACTTSAETTSTSSPLV